MEQIVISVEGDGYVETIRKVEEETWKWNKEGYKLTCTTSAISSTPYYREHTYFMLVFTKE